MFITAPRLFPRRLVLPILALTGLFCSHAPAQELMPRLQSWRAKRALQAVAEPRFSLPSTSQLRPVWVGRAQLDPPANSSAASSTSPNAERDLSTTTPPRAPRPITAYADLSFGFDGQTLVVADPTPREARIRRRIRVLNVSAEYPLNTRTNIALGVPVVAQTVQFRGVGNTPNLRGDGLGDISLVVQRRSRESKRGVETSASLGVVLPTGRDTFELAPNQLPTGNGFYQPFVRFSIRKLRVPLQLFGSVNYGQGLSRTVGGERFRLPASYGGEIGFSYVLGPEFSVSTSLNANRLSSPFLLDAGQHVAYLSQSLSYNSGGTTTVRASADLGLTDESTDAFVGVSVRRVF